MVLSNITLTTSDVIDLIGIFASLFIGVIAIIISILSLRQNSKMIEESTRPNSKGQTTRLSLNPFLVHT